MAAVGLVLAVVAKDLDEAGEAGAADLFSTRGSAIAGGGVVAGVGGAGLELGGSSDGNGGQGEDGSGELHVEGWLGGWKIYKE